MLEEKDVTILSHLRKDGRKNLTTMSRETSIPVSTIYDRLKKYMGDVIAKHTILLNYKTLGYDIRINILIKAPPDQRDALEQFLYAHHNVNTVARVNNGYDFMAEALFKTMAEFKAFKDATGKFGVLTMDEFFILDDIKRESFLEEARAYSS
jgi:DNA-binding Lrp family transcriptional regulator